MAYKIGTPAKVKQITTGDYWYILNNENEIIARCNTEVDARQIAAVLNSNDAVTAELARLEAIESAAREYVYRAKPSSYEQLVATLEAKP